jgi:hypothetical protein
MVLTVQECMLPLLFPIALILLLFQAVKKEIVLTCACRYHGTMDVQQERLNVYFNEVSSPQRISEIDGSRLLAINMFLGRF